MYRNSSMRVNQRSRLPAGNMRSYIRPAENRAKAKGKAPTIEKQSEQASITETAGSTDATLKDKFTEFCSELNTGNGKIVQRVERMVNEQKSEIHMLNSRIDLLHKQVDRQKTYYQKRELILREMYEEEISLLEEASHNNTPDCEPVSNFGANKTPSLSKASASTSDGIPQAKTITISRFSQTDCIVNKPACTSPLRVKCRDSSSITIPKAQHMKATYTNTSPQRLKSPDPAASIKLPYGVKSASTSPLRLNIPFEATFDKSPQRTQVCDVACMKSPSRPIVVTRAVQSDLQLVPADKPADIDYHTCAENSPLVQVGQKLTEETNRQINEDEAFVEAERMHEKTQFLYGRLNAVLREFHTNSTDIIHHKPKYRHRRRKPVTNLASDKNDPKSLQKTVSAPKLKQDQALQPEIETDRQSLPHQLSPSEPMDNTVVSCIKTPKDIIDCKYMPEDYHKPPSEPKNHRPLNLKSGFLQFNHDRTVNSDVSTLQTLSGM